MARPATGQVVERKRGDGTRVYALRFTAYRKRRYLTLTDGTTRARAEQELANVLADVRRGVWLPADPAPQVVESSPEPTFHEFASEWYASIELELASTTAADYRWRLSSHLLPYFAEHQLSAITVEEVDRYRRSKERERAALIARQETQALLPVERRERLPRPLSNNSINKTIKTLAAIHEVAVEYGFVDRNVARGRRRLLKEPKPPRTYLQADQDAALLAAAGELDAEARAGDTRPRRALLATLALAGLRIGEALDLRWRQVNLADRSLRVVASKTDTGVRDIDLSPTLTEILSEHRARSARHGATDLSSGRRRGRGTARRTCATGTCPRPSTEPTLVSSATGRTRLDTSPRIRSAARSRHCCSPRAPMCPT